MVESHFPKYPYLPQLEAAAERWLKADFGCDFDLAGIVKTAGFEVPIRTVRLEALNSKPVVVVIFQDDDILMIGIPNAKR